MFQFSSNFTCNARCMSSLNYELVKRRRRSILLQVYLSLLKFLVKGTWQRVTFHFFYYQLLLVSRSNMGKLFEFYFEFPDMLEFRKSEMSNSSRIDPRSPLETNAMSTGAKINAKPLRYQYNLSPERHLNLSLRVQAQSISSQILEIFTNSRSSFYDHPCQQLRPIHFQSGRLNFVQKSQNRC